MPDALLHPRTLELIDQTAAVPPHAVVLTGPAGLGKGSALRLLAARLLNDADALNHPGLLVVEREADKTEIGIDAVRRIQHFLSLKSNRSGGIQRVVAIEDANLLSPEAQNALLKTIEEPPADTVLILTAVSLRQLLPTVASRVQELQLSIPKKAAIVAHFTKDGHERASVERAVAMSGGMPGTTAALLSETSEHPMAQAVDWARRLLGGSKFERLAMIDELSKQRELAIMTCEVLTRMASLMLQNPKLGQSQQTTWKSVLTQANTTAEQLRRYANPKLALSSLSLHL